MRDQLWFKNMGRVSDGGGGKNWSIFGPGKNPDNNNDDVEDDESDTRHF